MPNGTIKFFNAAKGFGFITSDEAGKDVFVPASSAAAMGAPLKPGQRISFTLEPDARGPKAVNLVVIADAPAVKIVKEVREPLPAEKPRLRLVFYHDPASDKSCEALAALRAAGHEPHVIDYIATPPTRDELKHLSLLLRDGSQSLVRKYDPLFQELRLDDRFISENDFWDAIVEHPSLINGPVVAMAGKAAICRSDAATNLFLSAISPNPVRAVSHQAVSHQAVSKPADIPQRSAAPIAAEIAAPVPEKKTRKAKAKPTGDVPAKAKNPTAKTAKAAPKITRDDKAKSRTVTKKLAPKPARKTPRAAGK